MSEIKDKLKGVKDKVLGAGEAAKDKVAGSKWQLSLNLFVCLRIFIDRCTVYHIL
jgi:hypothetical protein